MNKNLLTKRKERIFFLYKKYLLNDSIDLDEELNSTEYKFIEEQKNAIKDILNKIDFLEEEVIKHLPSDWKWERINFLERSILINSVAEITLFKNKKSIVINEAVEFTKNFCELEAYKLINGILNNFQN